MPFCLTIRFYWNTTATNIQHWWEKVRGGNWSAQLGFFSPRDEPAHVRASARQIILSDNRLHQKPPEREQLAKENQYIIEQLAAPEVPVRRSGLQELLTSFLLQDLYLLFPHSSFCSSSSDNLVDLHSAVEWMHFPLFFFLFPHVCVCFLAATANSNRDKRIDLLSWPVSVWPVARTDEMT